MAIFFRRVRSEKGFPAPIVGADPTAPINLMEKPVHDHEQYNDGDQAGGGLEIKRGDTIHKRADDADGALGRLRTAEPCPHLVICRRGRNFCAMLFRPRRRDGFTLVELAIAVVILVVLMMLAVPSMNGVLADRRLRRSLDAFNA